MNLIPLQIHQQPLSRDQQALRIINAAHPNVLNDGRRHLGSPVTHRKRLVAQPRNLGQIHPDPPQTLVVHPPELRLQTFPERDDRALGMLGQKPTNGLVKGQRPKRLPLRPPRALVEPRLERVVDPLNQVHRHRILKQCVWAGSLLRPEEQRPEQGFGHSGEIDRDLRFLAQRSPSSMSQSSSSLTRETILRPARPPGPRLILKTKKPQPDQGLCWGFPVGLSGLEPLTSSLSGNALTD